MIAAFVALGLVLTASVWVESLVVEASMAIARAKKLDPLRYREDRGTWLFLPRWIGLAEVIARRPFGLAGVRLDGGLVAAWRGRGSGGGTRRR